MVPGVTLVQHGSEGKGYQFLVRGFDAAHGADFAVRVEGVPMNEWSNVHAQGYLDLGFLIPELVASVRVTKGPFTLEQGAFAMAGSADYQLGVEEGTRGLRAAYTVGSTNRHRGVVTYSPEQGGSHDLIASETLHDEGFGSQRRISKGSVLARRELAHSEHGELSLLTGASLARFELPGVLRDDDYQAGRVGLRDSYTTTSRGASMRALTALSYAQHGPRHQLRGVAYAGLRRLQVLENFTGYLLDPLHGDFRLQQQDAVSFGANLRLTTTLSQLVEASVGLGVMGDGLEQRQDHVDAEGRPRGRERALDAIQTLTHALLGVSLRPTAALRLDAGARLDVAHVRVRDGLAGDALATGTLPAVSPRSVLEWRVSEQLRVVAAYGRGFRPPEARAFTSFVPAEVGLSDDRLDGGEPAMTTSDSFELGARFRASRYLSAQASAFATFIARESVYDHVSGLNIELNGTRRMGAELSLRSNPSEILTLTADATVVDARFVASGNPVPMAPGLFGGARAVLGGERGFRAGLRFLAVAPRHLPYGARSSTLSQLDVTAGHRWERWQLELEVENVLNQPNRQGEYHYASHWQRSQPISQLPALHFGAGPPLNARLTLAAVF